MTKILSCTFLLFLSITHKLCPVSLVYTMKLQRIFTMNSSVQKDHKGSKTVTALPILYYRDRHIVEPELFHDIYEKRKAEACMLSARYVAPSLSWIDISTGVIHEKAQSTGTSKLNKKITGLDDIVINAGLTKKYNDSLEVVYYGLAGFPAKRKVTAQEAHDTFTGTRFFSAGAGVECSYTALHNDLQTATFLINTRFIHFFERKWYPILPKNAKIIPGNITDLLCAAFFRHKTNMFEIGYNPTFFTNHGKEIASKKHSSENFHRDTVYLTIAKGLKSTIGFGCARAYEKKFSTHTQTYWVYINHSF